MKVLKKIGFKRNWIYEVIVTTSDGKTPNAAPMGIFTDDFQQIKLEVYKDTKTCKNILVTREFGVNFVEDIELFYQVSFPKRDIEYRSAKKIKAPLLLTGSWLELRVKEREDLGEKISFTAEIVYSKVDEIKLINRGFFLTLESLINYTKLPYRQTKERELLKKEIRENHRVIKKVAPHSRYEKILKEIL